MISKEEIIEKVGVLLKELSDKFDYISDPGQDVNPLEFQLFEINAAYFAEHANLLRKLDEEARNVVESEVEHTQLKDIEHLPIVEKEESVLEKAAAEEQEVRIEEKVQEEPQVIEESQGVEEERFVEPEPTIFTPVSSEPVWEREQPIEEEPERKEEVDVPFESVEEVTSEIVVEERREVIIEEKTVEIHTDRPMSLNDRLSEQRKSMDAEKKHMDSPRRIKDIKSGINLNDKLLFIKDLFNGYSLAYSEAIELLNRFETFEDADRFLKTNYAQKNNWETKPASVEKLYAILRQRFG